MDEVKDYCSDLSNSSLTNWQTSERSFLLSTIYHLWKLVSYWAYKRNFPNENVRILKCWLKDTQFKLTWDHPPGHDCKWTPCQEIMNTIPFSIQHKENPLSSSAYVTLQRLIFPAATHSFFPVPDTWWLLFF